MLRGPKKIPTPYFREQLQQKTGRGAGRIPFSRPERKRLFGTPGHERRALISMRRQGRMFSTKDFARFEKIAARPLPGREKPRIRERRIEQIKRFWRRGVFKSRPSKGKTFTK